MFFSLWDLLTFLVNSSELGAWRQWEIPVSSGLLPRTNNISFDWSNSGRPARNTEHQHRERPECQYTIYRPAQFLNFSLLSVHWRIPSPFSGEFLQNFYWPTTSWRLLEVIMAIALLATLSIYNVYQPSLSNGISRYPCFSRISPKICHIFSYH